MKASLAAALALLLGCARSPPPAQAPRTRPMVIGHRGNPVVAVENTLPSLRDAFDLGADAVEIDVRLTSDRVPVVFHDDELERTLRAEGKVADTPLARLQTLKAHGRFDETAKETVPTLEQVLSALGGRGKFLLDIKSDGMAPQIAELLTRLKLPQDRFLVGAWTDAQVIEYREHLPGALLMASMEVPADWGERTFDLQRVRGVGAFEVWREAPPGFVKAAHARGMKVFVYTVNDEPQLKKLIAEGVDGIETDVPALLLHLLREH